MYIRPISGPVFTVPATKISVWYLLGVGTAWGDSERKLYIDVIMVVVDA